MIEAAIKVPQIGEAIHEVNIIKYLKSVGDFVQCDEPIVTLETNKASIDVEAPFEGIIEQILYREGMTVAVGETIIVINRPEKSTQEQTKIAAMDKVLSIPVNKLPIKQKRNSTTSPRTQRSVVTIKEKVENESLLHGSLQQSLKISYKQKNLIKTLRASAQHIIPANIQMLCDNMSIMQLRKNIRALSSSTIVPTRLEIISWVLTRVLQNNPQFCSRALNDEEVQLQEKINIGIAIALENDDLSTAVIENTASYDFYNFIESFRKTTNEAKHHSYAPAYHCLTISDLSSYGVVNAIPVVAYPAVGTLFIGKPIPSSDSFYFSLSFDHRLANGAAASRFLKEVCDGLSQKGLERLIPLESIIPIGEAFTEDTNKEEEKGFFQSMGKKMESIRSKKGMSVQIFAKLCGIAETDILNFEAGNKVFYPDELFIFSKALNIPVGSFFEE